MGGVIKRAGPCRLKVRARRTPFQALVTSIVFQQLNGTAASAILARVKKLFPGKAFPSAADMVAMSEEALRAAGLSRGKIAALRDVAAKTLEGSVPSKRQAAMLTDAELIKQLTEIRGVGPWTVEMLLIFTLGRPDILPVTDFGVRKGFAVAYQRDELPPPRELLAYGERWRPYRSTAAWYLWRVLDMPAAPRKNAAW